MSARRLVLLAAGGSLALLLGAFWFQFVVGLPPCPLCLTQRWPHAAAIVFGGLALIWPLRCLAAGGALAALATSGTGLYHAGIEQGWWPGPDSCTGTGLSGSAGGDLLNFESAGRLVMCDQISWQWLGLSMPAWNAIVSFGLALIWLLALRRMNRWI